MREGWAFSTRSWVYIWNTGFCPSRRHDKLSLRAPSTNDTRFDVVTGGLQMAIAGDHRLANVMVGLDHRDI